MQLLQSLIDARSCAFAVTLFAVLGLATPHSAYAQIYTRTITDAVGNQEIWAFEDILDVAKLVGKTNLVDNKVESKTYDGNGNLLTRTDAEGRVTRYTYNATNQRTSMIEADGTSEARTTIYEYISPDIDIVTRTVSPSVSTGLSRETVTVYDPNHNPLSVTINGFTPDGTPISRTTSYQYNAIGQVTQVDGPRTDVNDVTNLVYNACNTGGGCGQLASITNALGHTTTFDSYDGNGRLLQRTDPNGVVTSYTYHPRGWVLSITQTPPAGSSESPRVTQYVYDNVGQLTQMTTPDGIVITHTYDAAHYLRSVEDNLGNRMAYDYDLKGNRTQTETFDPDGTLVRTLDTTYDHRNHVTSLNAAGSLTQLIKDAVGNTTSQTDPNQNPSTTSQSDPLNRVTQMIDAIGGQTDYDFNVQDQLVQVTSPNGATTQYQYDDLGNLLSEISPDRGTMTYQHDAAGNVTQVTDAREVAATYTYDALNRITQVDYSGTDEDITYLYDICSFGIGRSCQVNDQSGLTEYQYDPWGNLTEQKKTELGFIYITSYEYDAGDRITAITYPDGRVITYTRDLLGRVETISATKNGITQSVITERDYEADHQLQTQTFGHGVIEDRSYDLQGRLTQQRTYMNATDPAGSKLQSRVYTYDANGNLLNAEIDETGYDGFTNSIPPSYFDAAIGPHGEYTYDALDRLTQETSDSGSYLFGYDGVGNRTIAMKDQPTTDQDGSQPFYSYGYLPASNRLTAINGAAQVRDAAGNLVAEGQRSFEYNQSGRLHKVMESGIEVATYIYNAQGQRTRKMSPSGIAFYHYDQAGRLIYETDIMTNSATSYIWADSLPVAQINTQYNIIDTLVYLHTDHLSTPRLATSGSGRLTKIVWRWNGSGFGEGAPVEVNGNSWPNQPTIVNLRMPGQYFDQETGYFYNWNRYYDPITGRYITSDPIGLAGGINTYGYVGQNPLIRFDFMGLCECTWKDKSYDIDRGFYFDKYDWPYLSYRFACLYTCTAEGSTEDVEGYIHEEERVQLFGQQGGVSIATYFQCKNSVKENIPIYNVMTGQISHYEYTPYGSFDPRGSGIPGLEAWAEKRCTDCEAK